MSEYDYFDIFMKSGKISDYIDYCNQKSSAEELKNATEYEWLDFKGTEYR